MKKNQVNWIKVEDELPDDLENVLFTAGKEVFKGFRQSSQLDLDWDYWYSVPNIGIDGVTHWMPLPELPEE